VNTRKTRSNLVFVALLLLLYTFSFPPAGAAQGDAPCEVASPPGDGLQSAAFGLTRSELDALYGPGNAAQTGWIYQFDGFDLTLVDCDLIVNIDPDGRFADPAAARELMRTLLPEDAVLAGTWAFGTIKSAPQDAEEWVSASLAARYRLLGEPFTGSILALYSYSGDAYTPGPVAFVELRAAEIP
jgi:hypothetical protein